MWLIGALVGQACLIAIVAVALVIPTFLLVSFLRSGSTLHALVQAALLALILPCLYWAFGICLLAISVICYRLLSLGSSAEDFPARNDWRIVPFTIYHGLLNACQIFFLRFIRATELLRLFYIGMGANIGAGTIVNTDLISDCYLIDIGKDSVIGGNVVINGHSFWRGILKRGRVKIGNDVTIGPYTTIFPNCKIEDGVVIAANSLVPSGATLKRGGVYVGVPVRLVYELTPTATAPS
jgi:acetyltransferase-like isoleucine patch superfamily enzyme